MQARLLAAVLLAFALPGACASDDIDQLLQQATQASLRGERERSIQKLTEVIAKDPKLAIAWYLRGREYFCAGKIAESVADFDKHVELEPLAKNRLWERGISYYYAGDYEKGAKQFEDYQTYHDQDVENSAWRYLCIARKDGVEKARQTLLPIGNDPRVPMMQIYALYQGKSKPEEVLAAANDNPPNEAVRRQRLFYAHLYLGLWHEAAGHGELAKEHLQKADGLKVEHYMWDVAHVHAARLKQ